LGKGKIPDFGLKTKNERFLLTMDIPDYIIIPYFTSSG
jgi:hypothetical protein